jgi:protein-S-isoprenylcysteine O-methyltransferase Ste14
MNIYSGIVSLCWFVFVVVWGVSAFTAKRTVYRAWLRGWWVRLGIGAIILLVVRYEAAHGTGASYLSDAVANPALNLLGAVLAALGIALAVWARLYLGRNWGTPMSVKENPELVTTGPYAYIRNPIYAGVILAAIGSALVNLFWLVLVFGSCIYFTYAAFAEETIMMREFPDAYPAYRARAKRFIPFIF